MFPTRQIWVVMILIWEIARGIIAIVESSALVQEMPQYAAQNFNTVPQRTQALINSGGNLGRLKMFWLTAMLQPGWIIWHKDGGHPKDQLRYVMQSGSLSATVLHVVPSVLDGVRSVHLLANGQDRASQLSVSNLSGWCCATTTPVAPIEHGGSANRTIKIVVDNGKDTLILTQSAMEGFLGLTVTQLKDLMLLLEVEVDGPTPTILLDIVAVLVKHVLPDITPADLELILAKRATPSNKQVSECYSVDAGDIGLEGLEPSERAKCLGEIQELREHKAKSAHRALPKPKPRQDYKKKKAVPLDGLQYTVAQIEPYMPRLGGAVVEIETDWHHRCKVWYPRDYPPYSHSASFEKSGSQLEAIRSCLRWVWREHIRREGRGVHGTSSTTECSSSSLEGASGLFLLAPLWLMHFVLGCWILCIAAARRVL